MNALARRLALVFVILFAACGQDNCCVVDGDGYDTGNCEQCVQSGGTCRAGRCGAPALTNLVMANVPKTVNVKIEYVDGDHYRFTLSDTDGNTLKFSGWGSVTKTPTSTEMQLNFGVANQEEWNSVVSAVSDILPFVKEEVYK